MDCVGKVTSSSAHIQLREQNRERGQQGEGGWGREGERKKEGERETLREFLLVHPES